ncbi:MAG: helix-turn-helix transcriptional regulator [Bacilli bacterium]|nr:helix-turn-helix transcriptional regulator [Bacilli bacterium]
MNQVKIGKFIADKRKEKKLTQQQLAEKLGVSDRAISNWENGKNMPDISLFPIISKELDVTVNDLMSGEKVDKKEYQEKFEENIIYTIDKTVKKENKFLKIILWTIFSFVFLFVMYISIESIYMHSNMDSTPLIKKSYSVDIHADDNEFFEQTIYSYGFHVKYYYKQKDPSKQRIIVGNEINKEDFELIRKDFYLNNGILFWSMP